MAQPAPRPQWTERNRLVDLIECLNAIPNAMTAGWDGPFEEGARQRLRAQLG